MRHLDNIYHEKERKDRALGFVFPCAKCRQAFNVLNLWLLNYTW